MEQEVIFNGQILTLTRFWATGEPCLWITDPEQIGMPKMEFVGGHPDEYCIFLKNLTETELAQITSLDGALLKSSEESKILDGDIVEIAERQGISLHIFNPVLKTAYIDLIPHNCMVQNHPRNQSRSECSAIDEQPHRPKRPQPVHNPASKLFLS